MVTIRVSDGSKTATDVFNVTVTTPNTPPSITGVPFVVTPEDTPKLQAVDLWLYANDGETPVSGLSYTIVSVSNAQAGVTIGSNRYINVNPAANWNGTAAVTVQVSDGVLTDTDSFNVIVTAVNDAPSFGVIGDVTTTVNTPVVHAVDLWAYATDVDNDITTLTYNAAYSASQTYPDYAQAGVSIESNRYINVNPAAGWSGAASVDVTANDGAYTATRTFVVWVTNASVPPVITHTPVATALEGDDVSINATVTDPSVTPAVTLYYRTGGVGAYTAVAMVNVGGDNFSGTIPGASVRLPSVQYYIEATNGPFTVSNGPHTISVTPRPDNTPPAVSGVATVPNRVIEGVDLSILLSAFIDDYGDRQQQRGRGGVLPGSRPGRGKRDGHDIA